MPAAAVGAELLCATGVFWSRINVLSEDAEIMDQERAAMFGHTITISDAMPSGARINRRVAGVAGKSHFEDFHRDQ
jgi:hypothetical protein